MTTTTTDALGDLRFEVPLYTLTEASRHLVVPRSTLDTWAHGYERRRSVLRTRNGSNLLLNAGGLGFTRMRTFDATR